MRRKLPDLQRLTSLRDEGKTYKQIALWVEQKTGERVSPATVGAALSRAGRTNPDNRYENHLPWVVKTQHISAYPARMLRAQGRRDAGLPLSPSEQQRLTSWLRQLREKRLLVAYLPGTDEGFHYISGEWPLDGIPIVRPAARRGPRTRSRAHTIPSGGMPRARGHLLASEVLAVRKCAFTPPRGMLAKRQHGSPVDGDSGRPL